MSGANPPAAVVEDGLWLDDLSAGMTFTSSVREVTQADIVRFAEVFDPQPFHVSPEAASGSFFRGLAGSGWHTAAIAMRLLAEALPIATGVIGGGAEVSWPTAMRPGDRLRLEARIDEVAPSRSRPGRGTATVTHRLVNDDGAVRQVTRIRLLAWRRPQT